MQAFERGGVFSLDFESSCKTYNLQLPHYNVLFMILESGPKNKCLTVTERGLNPSVKAICY